MPSLATIRRWLTHHAKYGNVAQDFKQHLRRPLRWIRQHMHQHRWSKKSIAYIIGGCEDLLFLRHPAVLWMVFPFKNTHFNSSLGDRGMVAKGL